MDFELRVRRSAPPTSVDDPDEVAREFLQSIGYLPKGYDPKTTEDGVGDSIPYRLFMDCFVGRPDKSWSVDEIMAALDTSRPTVYRHLNKLKALDLLEEETVQPEDGGQSRKLYRLRYGNLSKAWNFAEAHMEAAMENYRKTVDHLHDLLRKEGAMP
jgi:predicted transcriptional regulator